VTVKFNGTKHFDPGATVTASVDPDATAASAGITATGGTATVPDDWDTQDQTFTIPISTLVPVTAPNMPDPGYTVNVDVSGPAHDGHGDPLTLHATDSYEVWVECPAASDTTPPTIAYVLSPAAPDGDNGWYRSDVTLTWTVTENESPGSLVKTGCVDQSITADQSATTYSCSATSDGGSAGPVDVTIKRDGTKPTDAPVVSGTAGSNGWFRSNVSVAWQWTDQAGGSGVDPGNCTQSGGPTSSEGPAVLLSSSCKDLAGNEASDSRSFAIDKTAPVVSFSGNAGSYTVDQQVNITCGAVDPNGANGSGIASTTCANVVGSAAGFGLGAHSFNASATDNAGNSGNGGGSFVVQVTPASLCNLTLQLADGSAKYQGLAQKQKAAFDKTITALCTADLTPIKPGIQPAKKAVLIAAYKAGVKLLAEGDWLTKAQAAELAGFAVAL
jgi:hypothetical protein